MKRLFDLVVASSIALLLSPIVLMIMLLVRVNLGRPVFFRQARPGLNGQIFHIYKFRSMLDACDANGIPLPDEIRLTRFGKFLRSSSLDELPELWNVIKGDMSLVGPRPLLVEYLDHFDADQARRHNVKPGITGLAQVSGRNAISWEDKLTLDVVYVDTHSLKLDIWILLRTVGQVLTMSGISHKDHATMPNFIDSKNSTSNK